MPPRNQIETAAIIEKGRAELVVKYRANPSPWPDGIDHPGNRWYGDGSAWTEERIAKALAWPNEPRIRTVETTKAAQQAVLDLLDKVATESVTPVTPTAPVTQTVTRDSVTVTPPVTQSEVDRKREQTKLRVARWRERQRSVTVVSSAA